MTGQPTPYSVWSTESIVAERNVATVIHVNCLQVSGFGEGLELCSGVKL